MILEAQYLVGTLQLLCLRISVKNHALGAKYSDAMKPYMRHVSYTYCDVLYHHQLPIHQNRNVADSV